MCRRFTTARLNVVDASILGATMHPAFGPAPPSAVAAQPGEPPQPDGPYTVGFHAGRHTGLAPKRVPQPATAAVAG